MKKYNFNMMLSLVVIALIHLTASTSQFAVMGSDGLAFFRTLSQNDIVILYFIALLIFIVSLITGIVKKLNDSED